MKKRSSALLEQITIALCQKITIPKAGWQAAAEAEIAADIVGTAKAIVEQIEREEAEAS